MPGEIEPQSEQKQDNSEVTEHQNTSEESLWATVRGGGIDKWKILTGILGIFVLAGAVFGAYKLGQRQVQPLSQPTPSPAVVATLTPDPTADWETYTNTKYGYLIKYPEGWYLSEAGDISEAADFLDVKKAPQDITPHDIKVRVHTIKEVGPQWVSVKAFFDEIYNKPIGTISGPKGRTTKVANITISGYKAVKQIEETFPIETEAFYSTAVYVLKESNTVIKVYTMASSKSEESVFIDTFNLMLSTFRFLGGKWQTYIAPKTEFTKSFKLYYPQGWELETRSAIRLSKGNSFFEIKQGAGSAGTCLFKDDKDNLNAPAFATVFGGHEEI